MTREETRSEGVGATAAGAEAETAPAPWSALFRGRQGLYSALVIVGVGLHALQILVMAIIMPTVVADLGGAAWYTWPSLLYTVGSIIGAASVGPVWTALGRRRGYAASGFAFLFGTTVCALAPDMGTLIAGRALQGYAGGLVIGGAMALVSGLFTESLRRRILAAYQGTWMVAQLMGPAVGGAFAEIGWWRGSFWTMVPIMLAFAALAWARVPELAEGEESGPRRGRFPVLRLATLSAGVLAIALAGPAEGAAARAGLAVLAVALIGLTFRLDRRAENRLYPTGALSLRAAVGLALWVLFVGGMVQTQVTLFLPLLLQVVHGVTPLFVSFVSIVISAGWTVGTFAVSGWSGRRERAALLAGPLLMLIGLAGAAATATAPALVALTAAAFVLGLGVGVHNVHLVARTMANARKGEERITSAAMPSIRSLGTAFGAALSGMLAAVAGLGDATEAAAVGPAITFIYGVNLVPLAFAALLMVLLVRAGTGTGTRRAGPHTKV